MTAVDTAEDSPEATPSDRDTSAPGAPPTRSRRKRPRLDHVDAMRPVKQGGVVTTHSLLFFAPAGGIGVGASLLVTHVTRFAFMFISAAMLVYAYPELRRGALGVFWRRRLLAVALPYVTWTFIYFLMESLPIPGIPEAFRPTGGLVASVPRSLEHLGVLLVTGYYQLYYLVILLEFYVIYPAFLWLIRRTDGHHRAVFVISLALQLALVLLEQVGAVPGWMQGHGAIRELWNYQLYVVAGGIMAWHYQAIHAWLCRRWRVVVGATLATFVVAEAWYVVAATHLLGFPGDPSAAFQPAVIPFFVALIAALYLLGVVMANPRLPARVRAWVRSGADNSYGVYLSQVLLITLLSLLGWRALEARLPWPVVVGGAVLIVYTGAIALTAALARLPGARATAGRARQPLPARRPAHAAPAPVGAAALATPGRPGSTSTADQHKKEASP